MKVDFRLIAATNRDLAEAVREGEFRSDLFYRLNVFPVRVPPLRERREDIPPLVEHFVQKCARRMGKSITSIPKKTMDALMAWEWPGNVRELENFVERSVILTQGSVLASPLSELQPITPERTIVDETLEATEREYILRALRESHGQIGGPRGAAARLGLKRTTLQSKLKHLGINPLRDSRGISTWRIDGGRASLSFLLIFFPTILRLQSSRTVTIVRMGRGLMMGVEQNKGMAWAGSPAALVRD